MLKSRKIVLMILLQEAKGDTDIKRTDSGHREGEGGMI